MKQQPITSLTNPIPDDTASCIDKFRNDFKNSMSDDLHTPVVLAALYDPLKYMNDLLHTRKFFKGKKRQKRIESLSALEKEIRSVLAVLGLMPASYSEVLQQLREKALKRAALTEDDVQQKINARNSARENKEYENSDAIRKELAALGIALMDSPDGTVWRPTVPLALQE
ncbi:hypothetical protein C5167_046344 [Papaver somniferum]|uniref:Cysteinyl-tRNA synthetase class Ia DALR domain-containing protein n=1 Tax=Papaver somniferum TaxID=3469 RepID=A0A4Y7LE98_PAPSO|nr:hypothetical protein C5167_046344 [Papaver somniferum]